jgi:hypothetical protein
LAPIGRWLQRKSSSESPATDAVQSFSIPEFKGTPAKLDPQASHPEVRAEQVKSPAGRDIVSRFKFEFLPGHDTPRERIANLFGAE